MSETHLTETVNKLAERVAQLEARLAIQELQSRYTHYLLKQDFERIVDELFAKSAEISVEFSDSGVYRGVESVRGLYQAFAATRELPGWFIMHTTTNCVIELSEDCQSATAHWLSPGASGSDVSASWIWGLFYVDYVREDGQWFIQRSVFCPIFRNRYEESWARAADHGTVRILQAQPDAPPTLYRDYAQVKKEPQILKHHPQLPPRRK